MLQATVAYALVALAAGWVAWSIFVPPRLKMRFRSAVKRKGRS